MKALEMFFERLGRRIAARPLLYVFGSLLFALIFSPFMFRVEEYEDVSRPWIPPNSIGLKQSDLVQSSFNQTYSYKGEEITINAPLSNNIIFYGSNVFSRAVITDMFSVVNSLISNSLFLDVCAPTIPGQPCTVMTLTAAWSSFTEFQSRSDEQIVTDINIFLSLNPQFGTLISPTPVPGEPVTQADAVSLVFFTLPVAESLAFESNFLTSSNLGSLDTKTVFVLGNSFDSEFQRGFDKDIGLLFYGVAGSVVLLFILFYENGTIRFLLPIVSLLVPALAYSTGQGILGLLNFKTAMMGRAVPFLLLGLASDDIFIVMNARRTSLLKKSTSVLVDSLVIAGPAITLTTTVNVLALGSAALSSLPAIRSFGIEASISIALVLFYTIFITAPLASIDKIQPKHTNTTPDFGPFPYHRRRLFTVLIIVGIISAGYSVTKMDFAFDMSELSPRDSYLRDYFPISERYFNHNSGHLVLFNNGTTHLTDFAQSLQQVNVELTPFNWINAYAATHTLPPDINDLNNWLLSDGFAFTNDVVTTQDELIISRVCFFFSTNRMFLSDSLP
ncbi:hypothetical protein RCL1_006118 [Eukaryota sp. TZLM3-RCL]